MQLVSSQSCHQQRVVVVVVVSSQQSISQSVVNSQSVVISRSSSISQQSVVVVVVLVSSQSSQSCVGQVRQTIVFSAGKSRLRQLQCRGRLLQLRQVDWQDYCRLRQRQVVVDVVVVVVVLGLYGHRRLDGDECGLIHFRLLEQIEKVEIY